MNYRSEAAKKFKIRTQSPQALLAGSFAALIGIGSLLLWLPWSHARGSVGFLDALFTATSAVCVTGLVVVDTGRDFTRFGQVVILLLIQAGGLGVMTFAALAFRVFGRRMSLTSQAAVQDSIFQRDAARDFRTAFGGILKLTFAIEFTGAVVLFSFLRVTHSSGHALFSAVFHSISAFCNAGFSIYSDSLIGHRGARGAVVAIMGLIVLGGLGHTVLYELWRNAQWALSRNREPRAMLFSLHARTVLWTSGLLIGAGAAFMLVFGLTGGEKGAFEKAFNALFQSVTARTAGFNTVDIGALPLASLFVLVLLMFIGGSPGSCAGGVKTTSLAIWLAQIRAGLRGQREVRLFSNRIPGDLVSRTALLLALALIWNLAGMGLLMATEPAASGADMSRIVFEQISAFGTVGLSAGITPDLTVFGKLWIILTMFVGRLGPLTLALWIIPQTHVNIRYPKGVVMIG